MPNTAVAFHKPQRTDRLLRLDEVKRYTGLSTSSIYRLLSAKCFPIQIPLGARSVAWVESEVLEWMATRIALRPATQCPSKKQQLEQDEGSSL